MDYISVQHANKELSQKRDRFMTNMESLNKKEIKVLRDAVKERLQQGRGVMQMPRVKVEPELKVKLKQHILLA